MSTTMNATFKTPCPQCETSLNVPAQKMGKRGPCPKCETRITVREGLAALYKVPTQAKPEEDTQQIPESEPEQKAWSEPETQIPEVEPTNFYSASAQTEEITEPKERTTFKPFLAAAIGFVPLAILAALVLNTADPISAKNTEFRNEAVLEDVTLKIESVKIGPVKIEGNEEPLDGNFLLVAYSVTNKSDKKISYNPPRQPSIPELMEISKSEDQKAALLERFFTLKDDMGSVYDRMEPQFGRHFECQAKHESLYPGETVQDVEIFELPVAAAKELLISVPNKMFGGTGTTLMKVAVQGIKAKPTKTASEKKTLEEAYTAFRLTLSMVEADKEFVVEMTPDKDADTTAIVKVNDNWGRIDYETRLEMMKTLQSGWAKIAEDRGLGRPGKVSLVDEDGKEIGGESESDGVWVQKS